MTQPTPYERGYSFTDFASGSPSSQPPGVKLDAEYDAIAETLAGVRASLAAIQRDDGRLGNGSVGVDQLSDDARALLVSGSVSIRGAWLTLTAYLPGDLVSDNGVIYLVMVAHVADELTVDTAAGRIVSIFDPGNTVLKDELALSTGLATIGATGEISAQAALNLKASTSTLALATGLASIGAEGDITAQDALDLKASYEVLAASGGSANIGFTHSITGAAARTLEARARETVMASDFGSVSAASVNLALGAADAYAASLARTVLLPAGVSTIASQVNMRLGQSLKGQGLSTYLNLSGQAALTVPSFTTGVSFTGVADTGGLPVEVADLLTFGGPSTYPVFDMAVNGYMVRSLFLSAPGVGIDFRGGDGIVTGCISDLGVNHYRISARNLVVSNMVNYGGNIHYTVQSGAVDVLLNAIQSEYAAFYGVLFETGATGARNFRIANSTFIMNAQTATAEGAIVDRSLGSEFSVFNTTVRNHYGAGLKTTNANSRAFSVGFVADGLKTDATYAQSATMRGLHAEESARFVHKDGTARNLPGQPIEVAGAGDTVAVIQNFDFTGNTGGTAEVKVSNSSAGSKVFISGAVGDGVRPLLENTGSAVVYVDASSCFNFPNPSLPAIAALVVPKTSDVVLIQGSGAAVTSIVSDAGNAGRRVTFIAQGVGTWTDGGNLKLAGDFVTTADDAITLVTPDGVTWYEASRSVN